MIDNLKVLAMIPARGGSKGLPHKNILPLAGHPLLAWTIEAAHQSRYIDRTILSSEDDEIIAVAKQYGCEVPFIRPQTLSTDEATTVDVLQHAHKQLPGYDLLLVLQPTNPLRTGRDIDAVLERLVENKGHSCVTVTEPDKSPYWSFTLLDGKLSPLLDGSNMGKRRQELPQTWILNGAVYAVHSDWFTKTGLLVGDDTLGHPMPKSRSLDIDSEMDLRMAQWLFEQRDDARIKVIP